MSYYVFISDGTAANIFMGRSVAGGTYNYCNSGKVSNFTGGGEATSIGMGDVIVASGTNTEFTAVVQSTIGTETEKITFNFNRSSENYIRNVFNTNPVLTNTASTPSTKTKGYWLGESYEKSTLKATLDSNGYTSIKEPRTVYVPGPTTVDTRIKSELCIYDNN